MSIASIFSSWMHPSAAEIPIPSGPVRMVLNEIPTPPSLSGLSIKDRVLVKSEFYDCLKDKLGYFHDQGDAARIQYDLDYSQLFKKIVSKTCTEEQFKQDLNKIRSAYNTELSTFTGKVSSIESVFENFGIASEVNELSKSNDDEMLDLLADASVKSDSLKTEIERVQKFLVNSKAISMDRKTEIR